MRRRRRAAVCARAGFAECGGRWGVGLQLKDDDDYADLCEDVKEECGKHGDVSAVVIPRPGAGADAPVVPGAGRVFVEFGGTDVALKCARAVKARKFDGRELVVKFFSEEKFASREF